MLGRLVVGIVTTAVEGSVLNYAIEDELDRTAFSHASPNLSRVTANVPGDYLFFASQFNQGAPPDNRPGAFRDRLRWCLKVCA